MKLTFDKMPSRDDFDYGETKKYNKAMEEWAKARITVIRNWVILGVGALLILILAFGTFRTVGAGEVGIITRFGEVQRTAESGLVVKLPFIESLTTMDTRTQKEEVASSAVTKDLQDVEASLALNYSIDRETALKIYKELGVRYKDNIITPVLHESFKAGTAQYSAEELITHRSEAKEKVLAVVKERLSAYGVVVSDLNIVNLNFSEAFNKAIEQKAVAQQEVEKAKQELERTKVEAEKKVAAAKADAEAQRLQQSTLTDLMIKKMYIEKWNGQLPTTTTGNAGVMLNLGE